MENINTVVKNINVYGNDCIGSQDKGTDVMVTVSTPDGDIHNIHLTTEQAVALVASVVDRLAYNNAE